MTGRRKKWLIGIGAVTVTVLVALSVAGYVLANRLEPYIRTQAIAYLQSRFDSEVELAAVRVRMPRILTSADAAQTRPGCTCWCRR